MNAARLLLLVALAGTPLLVFSQQAQAPLASQSTRWEGVTADVTEFKRKGTTLTARLRLHNDGPKEALVELGYQKCYVLDSGAGKKYEVLTDSEGHAIAAVNSGDRGWRDHITPGQAQVIWMKFPAPPATTKAVSLTIEGIPPFDDLAIQDVP